MYNCIRLTNKSGEMKMKKGSQFSLSQEHKDMLRELAKEGHRSMTAELERIIEKEYNPVYRRNLSNPKRDGPLN